MSTFVFFALHTHTPLGAAGTQFHFPDVCTGWCKAGLRGHIATQMAVFCPLNDGLSSWLTLPLLLRIGAALAPLAAEVPPCSPSHFLGKRHGLLTAIF